jgi:hypothetical protein
LSYSFGNPALTNAGNAVAYLESTGSFAAVHGTNTIMDVPTNVLSSRTLDLLYTASGAETATEEKSSTSVSLSYSGSFSYTTMSSVQVSYNDTNLVSPNAVTQFSFYGVQTTTGDFSYANKTSATQSYSQNFTVPSGSGVGTPYGIPSLMSGSLTGSVIKE